MRPFRVLLVGTDHEERMEDALEPRAFTLDETEREDARIAEAAKTDSSAFGELYERYYPRVYRYVYHRVGNPIDAEDLTAVVFMKVLEALPSYKAGRSGFAPWLFRISRNSVVDHYRRGRSHLPLDGVDRHSTHGDPVTHAVDVERAEELSRLVQHLSPEQREVVLLRYAGELSFTEISSVLGKKEPAVRMLLHRGLRKLKAAIDDA
jgi:RNA polymerase sigma-70 factor (ECF subfamily)